MNHQEKKDFLAKQKQRREEFAQIAMHGLLSSENAESKISVAMLAKEAVLAADALMKALDET